MHWGCKDPGGRPSRDLNAVEELALLGGELLFGEDAAAAQVVELYEPVPDFEGGRALHRVGGRRRGRVLTLSAPSRVAAHAEGRVVVRVVVALMLAVVLLRLGVGGAVTVTRLHVGR